MASPLDTSVVHFHSGMPNMPILNGQAGTLIGVLNLLTDGGDIKVAATLQVVGGIATLGFTGAHAAQASPQAVIEISGVTNMPGLNGRQKVISVAPGMLRFPTTEPDGTAEGTIVFKMAGAGWQWVHSGPNKGFLRSGSPQRNGQGLRIDDSAVQLARVLAYESMADVDLGTNPFPTNAQQAGGGYWHRSTVSTAAAVKWCLFADDRALYFWNALGSHLSASSYGGMLRCFGDLVERDPAGDIHATVLTFSPQAAPTGESGPGGGNISSSPNTATAGVAVARSRGGATLSPQAVRVWYSGTYNNAGVGHSGIDPMMGAAADVPDGELVAGRIALSLGTGFQTGLRGDFPGLVYVPHSGLSSLMATADTVDGRGELEGRRLMGVWTLGNSTPTVVGPNANIGVTLVDITGPWRH